MIEAVEVIVRQPGHPDRTVRLEDGIVRVGRGEAVEEPGLGEVALDRGAERLRSMDAQGEPQLQGPERP